MSTVDLPAKPLGPSEVMKSTWGEMVWEFFVFGLKEARACVFAGSFLTLLLVSRQLPDLPIARYDLLFLGAVTLQVILVATGIESRAELLVLCLFHAVGMGLELFKTSPAIHSWSYPEPGFFKLGTVPLYSGFMYAAVASYMCQAWRILIWSCTAIRLTGSAFPWRSPSTPIISPTISCPIFAGG